MPKTVLLTGASGFIAKHVAVKLLDAGYHVRGSVRSLERGAEVAAAVGPQLAEAGGLDARLGFTPLDLAQDKGWAEAMQGVDALVHTASPFPMTQPRDPEELIRPAVDGALRALRAARDAGVGRVVMTSSSVAIAEAELPPGKTVHDEDDWTDPARPGLTPYTISKTLAERAAWDFVRDEAPGLRLTTINPSFVLGAPLDRHYGTSLKVIERLLAGRDPMLPRFAMACVDVRDVAEAHVRALRMPAAEGRRIIASEATLWFRDIAGELKAAFPDRRIARREAPDLLMRLVGLFDPAVRAIVPALGRHFTVSNDRARELLGLECRSARAAVREAGAWLVANGL